MVRKLLWTVVKSIFLIQHFIRFFLILRHSWLSIHLCIQFTTIVQKNLQLDNIVADLSSYPFFSMNLPQCRPIEDFFGQLSSIVYKDGWTAKNVGEFKITYKMMN
jgi:hypothetical protein